MTENFTTQQAKTLRDRETFFKDALASPSLDAQLDALIGDSMLFGYRDKLTDEQKRYVIAMLTKQITFVNARAGTGKTTLAVAVAALLDKPMYYVFAPVQERTMGYRPGTQEEKESEYITPLKDALLEIGQLPEAAILREMTDGYTPSDSAWVRPMSHVFARGINLKDCTVIIDEAANLTRGELKKMLTRCHDSCTVIVIGHTGQNDLPRESTSGFAPYIEHFRNEPYAAVCELTINHRGRLANHADELRW